MKTFAFHGWLIVEVEADDGTVGIGNAALAPLVTKALIDQYLTPLLMGQNPWDIEFLWQHMYRNTMAFGARAWGWRPSARWILRCGICWERRRSNRCFDCWADGRRLGFRCMRAGCTARGWKTWRRRAALQGRWIQGDETAVRMGSDGWSGGDAAQRGAGARGAEAVGDEVDVMADAYMGWTLDYPKRMLPLLEAFHLRWLEGPVIPDDVRGIRSCVRMGGSIAGGEHEFTVYGFRDLLEACAGLHPVPIRIAWAGSARRRKICALGGGVCLPVGVPHADGVRRDFHVVMASLIVSDGGVSPLVDVEVGNELFSYIFDGEPTPVDGFIDLADDVPGLGFTINEERLGQFRILRERRVMRVVS